MDRSTESETAPWASVWRRLLPDSETATVVDVGPGLHCSGRTPGDSDGDALGELGSSGAVFDRGGQQGAGLARPVTERTEGEGDQLVHHTCSFEATVLVCFLRMRPNERVVVLPVISACGYDGDVYRRGLGAVFVGE